MECGECTLCCDIPKIKELKKPAWKLCSNYDIVCKNCKIYETRPEECRNFQCSYWQVKKANIAIRPDKCGVMFEKLSQRIFLATLHPDYEFSEIAKKQIDIFMKQGFSVIFSQKNEKLKFYLSYIHNKESIYDEFKKLLKESNGCSSI